MTKPLRCGLSIVLAAMLLVSVLPAALAAPTVATSPSIRQLALRTNDLIYAPGTQRLYASVPSIAGTLRGNSITIIDPQSGIIARSVAIGSEPNRLALSDNNQYVYVGLNGAAAVRRFDVGAQTAGLQFTVGNSFLAEDIEVLPGQPDSVAISRRNTCCSPRHEGVAIYDNGVQRTQTTPGHTGSNVIAFGDSASTLYGHNNETTGFGFYRMAVTTDGVSVRTSPAV